MLGSSGTAVKGDRVGEQSARCSSRLQSLALRRTLILGSATVEATVGSNGDKIGCPTSSSTEKSIGHPYGHTFR
jgi:hypothetical protein